MIECHKCPNDGKGLQVCIKCTTQLQRKASNTPKGKPAGIPHEWKGTFDPSHHGQTHVEQTEDYIDHQGQAPDVDRLGGLDRFRGALRILLELMTNHPTTAKLLLHRICHPDESLAVIAKQLRMDPKHAHAKLKHVERLWPELRAVLPHYAPRQKTRPMA